MANEDTLAEARKARLTPARLTRDRVRVKHRKASKAGFNPERVVDGNAFTLSQLDKK